MADGPAGGELVIRSPAGSGVAVATDHLHHLSERGIALVDVARRARALVAQAAAHEPARSGLGGGATADELFAAGHHLERVAELAEAFTRSLTLAAAGYEATEELLDRAMGSISALAGAATGVAARAVMVALVLNPALLFGILAHDAAEAARGPGRGTPGRGKPAEEGVVAEFLRTHPELVSSPSLVEAVRLIASSSDDAVLAAAGVPPIVALALGDQGLGITGVAVGASGIMALGATRGVLIETPVRLTQTSVRSGAEAQEGAPSGSAERLERIPDEANQIRIERYTAPGEPARWAVYVSPTVTFDVTGSEPFDMTANMAGVAGTSPASLRAVEAAMAEAGVAATDQVQFIGYSQGGIVAARAAESGAWNTVGLETYGAPIGNVEIPEGVHGLTVRHTDDLVPATAGPDGRDALVHVERRAFAPGDELPHLAVPPHQKESYAATARMIDDAESALVQDEVTRLTRFGQDYLDQGGELTVFEFRAERVENGAG
ncbi:hypothetical protein [uncultured Schumannella sp.]|uniref:hypothetical protein n=1 Tax=uncultured Schumannella sp. TaxID=1195956 RepID=UPI0025FD807D|nr:hypothetical protein [uncultured Schumannella sp.]